MVTLRSLDPLCNDSEKQTHCSIDTHLTLTLPTDRQKELGNYDV